MILNDEKTPIDVAQQEIDDCYLNELRGYRHDLLSIQKEQITSYDKAILSLSGGALGVTIAFADKFGGAEPIVTWPLLSAWGCFSVAITLNVLSYLFSSFDVEVEVEKVRVSIQAGGSDIVHGNNWRRATQLTNILALVGFIGGVVLFGAYAYDSTRNPGITEEVLDDG